MPRFASARPGAMVALGAAAIILAACGGYDGAADSSLTAAMDSLVAANPTLTMSDAEVLGFLHRVNTAEVEAGTLAREKAMNEQIRAFARLLVSEHQGMMQLQEDLVAQVGVTAVDPPGNELAASHAQVMARLDDMERGAAFDSTYIATRVTTHRAVLDELELVSSTSAQIGEYLRNATQAIESHLSAADSLQQELVSPES
ncbi:MAG: DUF4142 domain-containing protein [Gemmatimonadaceae bacterium]